MPILGAFVWGLIAGIGRMFAWFALRWGGTIVANALLALGISFVATKYAAPAIQGIFTTAFSGLSAQWANLFSYVGLYSAASILVSAVLWKEGKGVVKGLLLKGANK